MSTLDELRAAYSALRAEVGDTPTDEQIVALQAAADAVVNFTAEAVEVEAETEIEETVAASAAAPVEPAGTTAPFVAAADVSGHPLGSNMNTLDLAKAVVRKASSLKGVPVGKTQYQIAQIQKTFDARAIVSDYDNGKAAIDYVTDERNTPQGSLIASGGWCTPSETWYDLLDLSSTDGLLSIPEVNLSRGGVRLIPGGGPQFAAVYADTGFCFTEAQDIAGDYGPGGGDQPKNCYKVECPEWTDYRLDVCGVCITAGILQNKAFPELTQDLITKALKAHAHRVDSNIIADIVTGSTTVTLAGSSPDASAAAPILNAIELQALDIRAKYRMSDNATIEVKLPNWARGLVRADLAYRNGVNLLGVSDSEIAAWFALRGVSVQYLANLTPLGGVSAATAYPTELAFLMYPAGTWVKGASDIIDLGVVYDQALLEFNNYTALFSEEGYNVLPIGPESRVVEIPVCPSGVTGSNSLACAES